MRNFLKYPPLEWRKRKEYCVPQGPSFAWAPWTTLHIANNRLRLKAPRHSPHYSSDGQERVLPGHDVLKDPRLNHYNSVMPNDYWGYAVPLRRRWAFWGPWMTGIKAELSMSITVVGRQPEYTFRNISFFHPRAFEMVLVQYFNDRYGHQRWDVQTHIPRHHGPVDWQRHNHLPIFNASCKIYNQGPDSDITNNLSRPDHLFLFPITDKHFVQVTFVQHLYSLDNQGKHTFDATPVQALQDAIFNSISLELSPESQASYNKIKAEVGDMRLTEEFAPLKWPVSAKGAEATQHESLFIER